MQVTLLEELKGPDPAQIRSRFITQAATVRLSGCRGIRVPEPKILNLNRANQGPSHARLQAPNINQFPIHV
jgi:hypothetical protein